MNTKVAPAELPRHVLHVLNSAGGGAALSTIDLICEQSRRWNIKATAVCHDAGSRDERGRLSDAVEGRVLFTPLYWWNRKVRAPWWKRPLLELRQWAKSGGADRSAERVVRFTASCPVDLIHTNTILTPEGALASRRLGIPHVWHVRELLGDRQPFQLRLRGERLCDYLLRYADRLIANSRYTANHLLAYCGAGAGDQLAMRLDVVHNGIDATRLSLDESRPSRDRLVVAMVGSLTSRWKRHDVFIEATSQVDPALAVEFRIYGHDPTDGGRRLAADPYAAALHRRVAERFPAGRFTWPGFVDNPAAMMAGIDILVQPTAEESFGRTIIEAMAAGVPVIAPRGGAADEIVGDSSAGLLTSPGDAGEIARAIEKLAGDTEARRWMGAAGRRRVVDAFSVETMTLGVLEAYRRAMLSARQTIV